MAVKSRLFQFAMQVIALPDCTVICRVIRADELRQRSDDLVIVYGKKHDDAVTLLARVANAMTGCPE